MPSTVNYVSPSALLPNIDKMNPPGFLQGMQYNQQMGDYQNQLSLQNLSSSLAAQQQKGELEDFQAARPDTLAALLAEKKATAATVGQKMQGEADKVGAEGYIAQQTKVSDAQKKAADNITSIGGSAMTQLTNHIKLAQISSQLQGPQASVQLQGIAKQMGVDINSDWFKGIAKNPQAMTQFLNGIDQQVQAKLTEQDAKSRADYKQATDVEDKRAASAERVAQIGANASMSRAQIMAELGGGTDRGLMQAINIREQLLAAGQDTTAIDRKIQLLRQATIDKATAASQQGSANSSAITDLARGAPVTPTPLPSAKGGKFTESQQDWINRAKRANPSMSDDQIIQNGKKLGKL